MKKILASMAVASVAGGTVIGTAQAQTSIASEDTQSKQASDVVTHENQVTVNADALRVRTGPSTSNTILGLVSKEQSVPVVDETDDWYKIKYNNMEAYVNKEYATPNHIKVSTTTLRVRTGPSTSNSTLGLVGEGEILQVTGEADGWYKIKYNNRDAYVSKEYVSINKSIINSKKQMVQASGNYTVNVSSLRARTGPSMSHPVVSVMNKGQVVQVVGEVQDWYKIKFNEGFAYINKDYVSRGTNNTSSLPQSLQTESVQKNGTYIVDAAVLRVRTGPANYHPVIGGVLKGQSLQVVDIENGWYKIKYNNRTGYVSGEFVKFAKGASTQEQTQKQEKSEQAQQPTQEQGKQAQQVQQPTQEQEKQEVVQHPVQEQEKQEVVQQPAKEQKKQEVVQQPAKEQKKQEVVQQPSQEQEKQEPAQNYYVKSSSLNVRTGAGMNYEVIGVVEPNQKVQVVGQQAGWYKINYNGKVGFVGMNYLSKTKVANVEEQPQQQPSEISTTTENKASGFIKPSAGSYTSGFEKRGGQMHYGLDIAASGTVSVSAAADGVVTRSYYSESYGNVVFISHNMNGQTYTTVYAHLNSRSVSAGQSVKQGQQIGFMGNTGQSEGQHLHFEVHKGEWNAQKSNAVNPKLYIK
ncbi:Peptidase, M23/M37 [Bacillus cereus 95/8201]|uniref:SH3 domain-containing protein n=1 Tax=Bacillus cereus group TaxID=86661 RepID=UPI0001A08E9C|nr:SH3 domain-containing protein [Bacillus cereus]AJH60177.1 SH3 domain protein [Bacillus cereus]AJK37548.1 SH3 domain protein [Bacillus cereus]EEL13891.1 Peptidase, M23/M37 [Bacillus cereus 95/8201]QKH69361.1 SH3 domain-containing protein [Bacillus cereus]QKH71458.1 SH3 domain-containing protein [Bacillus cereus]